MVASGGGRPRGRTGPGGGSQVRPGGFLCPASWRKSLKGGLALPGRRSLGALPGAAGAGDANRHRAQIGLRTGGVHPAGREALDPERRARPAAGGYIVEPRVMAALEEAINSIQLT